MRNGRLQMITQPLNLDSLLATANGDSIPPNVPARTDVGHINLHVANLKEAKKFLHDFLGLAVTARIGRSATFLAAGDYHHHVAVNTWGGKKPAPANSVGLISYRLEVPDAQAVADIKERTRLFRYEARMHGNVVQVRDPNGHWLELDSRLLIKPK